MDEKDYMAPRTETFDVVLLKNGLSTLSATSEDFKRVTVTTTEGAYGARSAPEVEAVAATGFNVYQVTSPGVFTEGERLARQRAHDKEFGAFDRSRI